ncbi:MAG TPA: ATP-binding protein [Patescibacteria group bacterium]|nr:ATP-binding protein [Patescibacteria group bacterium]
MGKEEYKNSGVPERHKSFRPVTDNKNEKWGKVYDAIKEKIPTGAIFAIVGTRGAGKTQLGASLVGYVAMILDRGVMYRKAFDVFLRIREAMHEKGDSEQAAVKEFSRQFFLVIDAYEVRGETEFENRIMDHIIDLRYDAVKPTLIISNETPEKFSSSVGPSIIDRIKETGGIIEMDWESFR